MVIKIYDLSCSSCRHTHAHWCILPNCVLYHLRKLVAIFLVGARRKRECKWVQTAGAFLVARSDGGPGGLTHQPLVLPPPFRQKPTGEKVGKLLQQRDQMVRKVKSTAHSVSTTLLVTWVRLLMLSWPTGFSEFEQLHHLADTMCDQEKKRFQSISHTHLCLDVQYSKVNSITVQFKCELMSSSVFSKDKFILFTQ